MTAIQHKFTVAKNRNVNISATRLTLVASTPPKVDCDETAKVSPSNANSRSFIAILGASELCGNKPILPCEAVRTTNQIKETCTIGIFKDGK